ncbi:MAG: c-type cytochrome [Planctomyces sp.]|nr:c-type cytochrome [Planctomyces sp.]
MTDSRILSSVRTLFSGFRQIFLAAAVASTACADEFPKVFNTEADGQNPPSADEMIGMIKLPEGFNISLFAGDPDVQQPICMDFDDQGRLWVAENYTYSGGPYETKLRDRIVIFEDKDGDGKHDSRKVFWDQGFMLTSLIWGFDGCWILHDGTLSWIPDKDRNGVPDGPPVVKLDGWSKDCGHNFVSGLVWGPDGWLYGRHGIVDTSYPGKPGTPREERPFMNCGVWRFHPTTEQVEVVCNGTTNPWGLDYNENGHFFMTNNVQGHLWHVIPGAHYRRMYGQDFNPHAYELMDMTADHYHWDTNGKWTDSRDGKANDMGGGHSHVGAVIYQGENFPESYRGKIFMCNTHGRRINVDRLDREGSGYVGRHEPDFMIVNNPWFRGVDLKQAPDGTLFVADWSDNGECHDHDGIHRTSGRIYRIAYGTPKKVDLGKSLADRSAPELFPLVASKNGWLARHSRRLIQEQVGEGKLSMRGALPQGDTHPAALQFGEAIGTNTVAYLEHALKTSKPEALERAVYLACDTPERQKALLPILKETASKPQPANVLMGLVSVLQKLPAEPRAELATAILSKTENATTIRDDVNLTLMTWYGIEPLVTQHELLPLLNSIPKLRQFAVRRASGEIVANSASSSKALEFIAALSAEPAKTSAEDIAGLLSAFRGGVAGRVRVDAPASWKSAEEQLRKIDNDSVRLELDALSLLFGDGAAIADLRSIAGNGDADPVAREQAILALAQARDNDSLPMFYNLLGDRAVYDTVIPALAGFEDPQIASEILSRLGGFKDGNRSAAFDTLASRESFALRLIDAIQAGRIDAAELTAGQVRQLLSLGNSDIKATLDEKWGIVQDTPAARTEAIARWQKELTAERMGTADLQNGSLLFRKSCATCHKLYGEGQTIAPDLTGSNRSNLEYVLMNIIDPSSVVPKQFTTSVVVLKSGRIITGVIVGKTDQTVSIQTDKELLMINPDDIEESKNTGKSLMPDGMLDSLTPDQVRDLIAFVMYRR